MEAVQMNTRIDRNVKARGDAVFARHGYTASQVVRMVWDYAGKHQDVPSFMKPSRDAHAQERQHKIDKVRAGTGLAVDIARSQCGYQGSAGNLLEGKTWREVRDKAYDSMLDEMEERCSSTPSV